MLSIISTFLVKALTEGTWNYHIPRLGAPFGMDAVDFPIGCSLDFAVIKILTAILHNPFLLLLNLYWLLTIAMAGAFAALFFRSLQISHLASASFGTLFAVTPFVFYRNISHWNLVQFIVPAAAYLGIDLARGVSSGLQKTIALQKKETPRRILLVRLAICVAIGLTYIYWAFFACIVIAIGCLIGLFRFGNKRILLVALVYMTVIGAASARRPRAEVCFTGIGMDPTECSNNSFPAEADIFRLADPGDADADSQPSHTSNAQCAR